MQDALTPGRRDGRPHAGPAHPTLLLCTALLWGACGEVIDVSDRVLCGSAGYRVHLPTTTCEPAQLQLCTYEDVGPAARMEPLDCREGVGYLDNPDVMHTRCESALLGRSGERCGAEFMCARHQDDSCCFEFVSCSYARSLLRSRVCAENCLDVQAGDPSTPDAGVGDTSCDLIARYSTYLTPAMSEPPPLNCHGGMVCTDDLRDLETAQPLSGGLISAYFCAGGRLQRATFLDYSFAPTVASTQPPILSAKRPGAAD